MEEGKVSPGQLVEAGEDAAVLLDLADEALHEMSFLVEVRVVRVRLPAPRAAVSLGARHSGVSTRGIGWSRRRGLRSHTHP